jgi:hypothetical protein
MNLRILKAFGLYGWTSVRRAVFAQGVVRLFRTDRRSPIRRALRRRTVIQTDRLFAGPNDVVVKKSLLNLVPKHNPVADGHPPAFASSQSTQERSPRPYSGVRPRRILAPCSLIAAVRRPDRRNLRTLRTCGRGRWDARGPASRYTAQGAGLPEDGNRRGRNAEGPVHPGSEIDQPRSLRTRVVASTSSRLRAGSQIRGSSRQRRSASAKLLASQNTYCVLLAT